MAVEALIEAQLDMVAQGGAGEHLRRSSVEVGLRGLPPTDRILFYGIFDLSSESVLLSSSPERGLERLWTPPRRELPDSQVSWINALAEKSTLLRGREADLSAGTLFMEFAQSQRSAIYRREEVVPVAVFKFENFLAVFDMRVAV